MGIFVAQPSDSSQPQAVFIEGFGALFQFQVSAPLLPPPPTEPTESPARPDSEWEDAKRELYGLGEPNPEQASIQRIEHQMLARHGLIPLGVKPITPAYEGRSAFGPAESGQPPYQAQRVIRLKRELVEVLENAANIRQLQPTDTLVIAVRGGAHQTVSTDPTTYSTLNRLRNAMGQPRPSTLTIQVKKGDADNFAAGKMSADDFAEKAIVRTY